MPVFCPLPNPTRPPPSPNPPDDVFVLQLSGSKTWTTCTPRPTALAPDLSLYSSADRCQLHEMLIKRQAGCTAYSDADLARMDCSTFELAAGDTLYLPKGVVHFARTGAAGSAHLTLSLERAGGNWENVLAYAAAAHGGEHAARIVNAIRSLAHQPEGLALLEAFPRWLVGDGCLRQGADAPAPGPSSPNASATVGRSNCRAALRAAYRARVDLVERELARQAASTPPATYGAHPTPAALAGALRDDASLDAVLERLADGRTLPEVKDVLDHIAREQAAAVSRARRSTSYVGYTCDSNCDGSCTYTCSCNTGCNDSCDEDCDDSAWRRRRRAGRVGGETRQKGERRWTGRTG